MNKKPITVNDIEDKLREQGLLEEEFDCNEPDLLCEWCRNAHNAVILGSNNENDSPPICQECLDRMFS